MKTDAPYRLPWWIGVAVSGCLAFMAIAWVIGAPAHANQGLDRSTYIRAIEPICAKDTRQNARILRGVRQQVAQSRYAPAARRFVQATRAYTGTLRAVLRVPRPAADRSQLNPWIRMMLKQRSYLVQITRALQKKQGLHAQRISLHLIRNVNQANAQVVGYGFKHCIFDPAQFL